MTSLKRMAEREGWATIYATANGFRQHNIAQYFLKFTDLELLLRDDRLCDALEGIDQLVQEEFGDVLPALIVIGLQHPTQDTETVQALEDQLQDFCYNGTPIRVVPFLSKEHRQMQDNLCQQHGIDLQPSEMVVISIAEQPCENGGCNRLYPETLN